jgi:hypothetical protein
VIIAGRNMAVEREPKGDELEWRYRTAEVAEEVGCE